MADPDERIMLLDTASLYFRAYFGVPESITAPDGTPVNAVRGLVEFIARLVRDYSPTQLVACWDDDWRPEFRVAAIPSYKAHRVAEDTGEGEEEVPDTLAPQVPIIAAVLEAVGIPRVGAPGFEADDVIGTLTARATSPVRIVTGDRDLFQLVDDSRNVAVVYTAARGVGRAELVDDAWLQARYDIPRGRYAEYSILRGDPSDGLPGVKGVGERTAAALLNTYGGLSAIRAAAGDSDSTMTPSMRARISAASDYLDIAPEVVLVVPDVDLPTFDARLPTTPANPTVLAELVERWGLESPVARLTEALAGARR